MSFHQIKEAFCAFSSRERLFVFFILICGFCIGGEYAIARPASQSLFLATFSSKSLPILWIATIPLNFALVFLYNRLLKKVGPFQSMSFSILTVIAVNALFGIFLPSIPSLIFLHFAWKDIYILLMFKQMWSLIHTTIHSGRAKILYGFIFSSGTIGSIIGSLVPWCFAETIRSQLLFFCTIPIYALLFFAYNKAWKQSSFSLLETHQEKFGEGDSNGSIFKNRYLLCVLLIVVFMQVSIALAEYGFNSRLEFAISQVDLRTAYFGRLFSIVSISSLAIQLLGGAVLLQWLGLRRSHFFVPLVLSVATLGHWILPGMLAASACFVLTKSMDFSFFGIIREMLYHPLSIDEKFRAKAMIDVFAYRSSKACASLFLLFLQSILSAAILIPVVHVLSFGIFIVWIGAVFVLFRKYGSQQLIFSPVKGI